MRNVDPTFAFTLEKATFSWAVTGGYMPAPRRGGLCCVAILWCTWSQRGLKAMRQLCLPWPPVPLPLACSHTAHPHRWHRAAGGEAFRLLLTVKSQSMTVFPSVLDDCLLWVFWVKMIYSLTRGLLGFIRLSEAADVFSHKWFPVIVFFFAPFPSWNITHIALR